MKTVYLGGPILGANKHEANDWRYVVSSQLGDHGIRGVSPLRCEPLIGDTYAAVYDDPRFGTSRAITSKNVFDVKNCDLILCYFPDVERLSLGTLAEMQWAFAWGKPAIVVTLDDRVRAHPVLRHTAGWLLTDLDEAVDVAVGILGGYTREGKNV
jgi:nucleoside 2-deoxyribosyltransferase